MPIDPSIAMGVRAPQFESPVNALGQLLQVQAAQQQNQLGQAKLDEYQRGVEKTNRLQALLAGMKPDAPADEQVGTLTRGGFLPEARSLAESSAKVATEKRAADKSQLEAISQKLALGAQILGSVKDQASYDAARATAQQAGLDVTNMPPQYDAAFVAAKRTEGLTALQQVEQHWKQQNYDLDLKKADETARHNGATEKTSAGQLAVSQGQLKVAQRRETREASDDTGSTSFTPEAIDNAAARYNFDGTLPPMGMGKSGSAGRALILNRAAQLKAGVDPVQQRADQLGNKNEVAARGSAIKSFATGKDGQAVQSANTALNHLDTIRQLAEAQKSGDVQAFNRAARTLGAQFGQAAPTNLNAALIMVAPEVSKAVIGAGGTGHERDQAIQALNPNGSPDQIIGGTQTMQELFGGRLTEAQRTYERTTGKKDFRDTMLSPAAQRILDRAHGTPGAPANAGVPDDIAALLKKHGGK